MIDFRNLETFFWVAKLGSFRGTAEKLNTTQPAISARIAQLEASLDVLLLNRDGRRPTLTVKGVEWQIAKAMRAIDQARTARR